MNFVSCGIKLLASMVKAKEGYNPIEDGEFSNEIFSISRCSEFQFRCGSFMANWTNDIDCGFEYDNISSDGFRDIMIKCLESL